MTLNTEWNGTCFPAWRITLLFLKKIAAIVLDLISYFDANISRFVQSTLPKTLKCVSFLSQKVDWLKQVRSLFQLHFPIAVPWWIYQHFLLFTGAHGQQTTAHMDSQRLPHCKHLLISHRGACLPEVFLSFAWVQSCLLSGLYTRAHRFLHHLSRWGMMVLTIISR